VQLSILFEVLQGGDFGEQTSHRLQSFERVRCGYSVLLMVTQQDETLNLHSGCGESK